MRGQGSNIVIKAIMPVRYDPVTVFYIRLPNPSATTDLTLPMSKDENGVLTGHIRSDIIVLSSVLNGMQVDSPSLPRDKTDDKLRLLSYISAILTIGDDNSPVAHSVHAVSGRINVDTLECLVCAENMGQTKKGPAVYPPTVPAAGSLEEVDEADNAERGAKLLENWDRDLDDDLM